MVSQGHGESKHRVAILFPVQGRGDKDLAERAERRMRGWFGNAEIHMGAMIEGDLDDPSEIVPTAIVHSDVSALSDLALARVFGLGLVLAISDGKEGVAVAIDDDLILL